MANLSSVIYSPLGKVIILAALAILVIEIELSIVSVRQRRTFDTINLIWGIVFFTCLMDMIYVPWYVQGERNDWTSLVAFLRDMPWIFSFGIELIMLVTVIVRARIIYKYRKERITKSSIKEAMDKLPAGICILRDEESVILTNLKMKEYINKFIGNNLSDGKEFWNYIKNVGKKRGDRYILKNDEMYISFKKDELLVYDKCYDEIKAFDVTEQARLMKKLEEKNAKLRDVQYRMKAYQVRAADMFMDQELLDARVAVHDGLGALLLQSRSYLDGHMDDEEELLKSLKYTNGFLLSESEAVPEERDHFKEGLRMAEGIGIKVVIECEEALHKDIRNLVGQAIGECAANTVKHAGGDEIQVKIESIDKTFVIEITNNGEPPEEDIKETGGLLSLRHMTENLGGDMTIYSEPTFKIKIILRDDVNREEV